MNKETNNEMDLLLRRLGRRAEPAASSDGNHLDADELSAYAEKALPAAARSRYTEHLAECSTCRKLVAELSSAAGVANVVESAVVPGPSALRKFLATLLSPMVIRYAAPALGLIVVAVIGFVILRRNQSVRSDYVSQVTNQQAPAAAPEPSGDSRGRIAFDDAQEKSSRGQPAQSPEADKNKQATHAPPPPNMPMTVDVEVRQKEAAVARAEDQPAAAGAGAAATPAPTPTAAPQVAGNVRTVQSEAPPKKAETPRDEVTVRGDEKSTADFRVAEAQKREAPSTASRAQGLAKLKRPEKELSKDDSAETRSVAGRRFRKRDGVWIDTAYDSSKETMTLTRGSERYRSLIADEPQIKTIADELDGDIIVVWKGHTYRIR